MLDQNDLKILAEMFSASEARMMKRMDRIEERMDRIEERMDRIEERIGRIEERMDRIEERMDRIEERMDRIEERMDRIEERMDRIEKRMDAQEEQQKKMETNIYDELGRVQSYLERKIDSVQNDMSEMKKYYRIERVESTTSAAILKIVSNLQKDVEELKRKIA